MNRRIPLLVLLAISFSSGDAAPPDAAAVLDVRTAQYLEDEQTGRRLADLRAELVGTRDRAEARLRISATGPLVEPTPGFEGIAGANRITARELTRIVEDGRLRVETRNAEGGTAPIRGAFVASHRGRVPIRRVLPDGALDLDGRTPEYLLALEVRGGQVEQGRWDTYVIVDRLPRLRITYTLGGETARIETIESLGAHDIVQ